MYKYLYLKISIGDFLADIGLDSGINDDVNVAAQGCSCKMLESIVCESITQMAN